MDGEEEPDVGDAVKAESNRIDWTLEVWRVSLRLGGW